mgnify:CR=1 FL=1
MYPAFLCALTSGAALMLAGCSQPMPDEIMGEAVRAHVVLEEGATLGVKDLEAACRQRLEIFMVPRDILIETELPKTPNGKVSKRELRARVG